MRQHDLVAVALIALATCVVACDCTSIGCADATILRFETQAGLPISTFEGTVRQNDVEISFACEDGVPVDSDGRFDCDGSNGVRFYFQPPERVALDAASDVGTFAGDIVLDRGERVPDDPPRCMPECRWAEERVVLD